MVTGPCSVFTQSKKSSDGIQPAVQRVGVVLYLETKMHALISFFNIEKVA